MNILLIAAGSFAPWNVIGAIRWTKICKYLSLNGHSITVIAHKKRMVHSDELLVKDSLLCKEIIYVDENATEKILHSIFSVEGKIRGMNKEESEKRFNTLMMSQRILRIISYKAFSKKARQHIKKLKPNYDIVVSTNPISAHWTAMYAAHKFNIPWIADFRDPLATPHSNSRYNLWIQQWQNRICEKADHVIAVSKGLKTVLCSGRNALLDKTSVIYNGYDPADRKASIIETGKTIRFIYTGILYTGKRDLSAIFEAIRSLDDEGLININNISFEYAGNEFNTLMDQAKKYGLEGILNNHGFVSRSESLLLQAQADVLVMATYNDKGNPGVKPGKLYEYMMMRKPILALVNGEIPDSELKDVIQMSDVGFCYEICSDKIDSLKEFIMCVLKAKMNGYKLPYKYKTETFEYPHIAGQVNDLIMRITEQ